MIVTGKHIGGPLDGSEIDVANWPVGEKRPVMIIMKEAPPDSPYMAEDDDWRFANGMYECCLQDGEKVLLWRFATRQTGA